MQSYRATGCDRPIDPLPEPILTGVRPVGTGRPALNN